jgi:hypothetical protein
MHESTGESKTSTGATKRKRQAETEKPEAVFAIFRQPSERTARKALICGAISVAEKSKTNGESKDGAERKSEGAEKESAAAAPMSDGTLFSRGFPTTLPAAVRATLWPVSPSCVSVLDRSCAFVNMVFGL